MPSRNFLGLYQPRLLVQLKREIWTNTPLWLSLRLDLCLTYSIGSQREHSLMRGKNSALPEVSDEDDNGFESGTGAPRMRATLLFRAKTANQLVPRNCHNA
jgi:hypothetical protein